MTATTEVTEVKIQRRVTAVSSDGVRSTRNCPAKWEDGPAFAVETRRVGVANGQARVAWFFKNRADAVARAKEVNNADGEFFMTSKGKKAPVVYANHTAKVINAEVFTVKHDEI